MTLIFLTARFDENRGVWLYTVSDLTRTYTRKWFWIDLVRASAVAAEMCQPQSVFRAASFFGVWLVRRAFPAAARAVCVPYRVPVSLCN